MNLILVTGVVPLLAFGLDWWLGEPRRWHPLVGFGQVAATLERRLNSAPGSRVAGFIAWAIMVLPAVLLALSLELLLADTSGIYSLAYLPIPVLALYWAIGWRSLSEHVKAVDNALATKNLPLAREQVGRIVTRDCGAASELEVRRAAIESALENTSDAIIGPLFWFVVAGIPGVILYRLSNTLDAMWGYRNPRFYYFGWAAARIDDLFGFIPARFTALGFVLVGAGRTALSAWRRDAPLCDSPNAGPVMCAGAGALNLRLGGPCVYHGQLYAKAWFGGARDPGADDISAALHLINRCVGLWLLIGTLILIVWGPLYICWGAVLDEWLSGGWLSGGNHDSPD